MALKITALVLLFFCGIINLITERVSKTSYFCCWLCLLISILEGILT